MKPTRSILFTILILTLAVYGAQAQGACDLNVNEIIARVTEKCAGVGDNQVCYGNQDVQATPRLNTVDFVFQNPGDIVSLSNVQSLFVSEIDPQTDRWGVAQMRLQVASETGLQDVTMLLFGAFNVDNAIEASPTLDVRLRTVSSDIYSAPDLTSLSLGTELSGAVLRAVARLADSSWIRIENVAGIVGWIPAERLSPVDSSRSFGLLPVEEADSRHYGAMQAFYFSNGNSQTNCANLASDGLLIQTPEGVARVSLLINEVSIELTGGGAGVSGTALIQADPASEEGMAVNIVQGSATVQTADGASQTVNTGQQSTIPLNEDLQPSGAPSEPLQVDLSNINVAPLLPIFNAPNLGSSSGGVGDGGNVNIGIGTGNNTTTGTGSGANVGTGSGTTTGNSTGSGSGGSGSSGSGSGVNVTLGSGNNTSTNPNLPTSLDDINRQNQPPAAEEGLTQGNIIALVLAIIAAIVVLGSIVFYTWNYYRKR